MKRFKTKQEFENEFGENWTHEIRPPWGEPHMNYLFGCIFDDQVNNIPERYARYLTESSNTWGISAPMLTDKPHPYMDGDFYIDIEVDAEIWNKVQAKALACGFKWVNGIEYCNFIAPELFISKGSLSFGEYNEIKEFKVKLTLDQFMEGYDPRVEKDKSFEATKNSIMDDSNAPWNWKVSKKENKKIMCLMTKEEAEKYDPSYNLCCDVLMFDNDPGHSYRGIISNINEKLQEGYTLVTLEEFRKVYPLPKKKYKWKGYEVKKEGDKIKVCGVKLSYERWIEMWEVLTAFYDDNGQKPLTVEEVQDLLEIICALKD